MAGAGDSLPYVKSGLVSLLVTVLQAWLLSLSGLEVKGVVAGAGWTLFGPADTGNFFHVFIKLQNQCHGRVVFLYLASLLIF